ncbi:hypothetical protein B0H19DRAFT_237064 [Mycena capillaripes]|nr:hypothetical protein B0H19DRAFT_237064 [Mycena capillaripes]
MRDVGVALSHPDVALLPTSFIDQVSVWTKNLSWLPIRFRWLDTMCEHGMSELSRVSIRVSFMGGADGEDGMDVDADDAGPSTSRAGRVRKMKAAFAMAVADQSDADDDQPASRKRRRTRMKPKDKVNEDDETEWEDCSDSEESSEDEDADAELSNDEVAENLPAKLNPTLGKNRSRRSKPEPAKKKRKTTGGGKGKEKATNDGDLAQGEGNDARGKQPSTGSRTVMPPRNVVEIPSTCSMKVLPPQMLRRGTSISGAFTGTIRRSSSHQELTAT